MQIKPRIIDVFTRYNDLIYLYSAPGIKHQLPNVGYHGTTVKFANNIIRDGLRESETGMLGPCFYFGTFRKAIRYAGWTSDYKGREDNEVQVADENGKYRVLTIEELIRIGIDPENDVGLRSNGMARSPGMILRFAMFTGNMKVLLNHPEERDDYSDLIQKKITDDTFDEWEQMTIRLHDHDGVWRDKYDSIYVGRVTLPNGGLFLSNPEFGLKNQGDFTLLTSHSLDDRTLAVNDKTGKYKWEAEKADYSIL